MGRRYPGQGVEDVGVGTDQDAGLASLDPTADDLGRLVRRGHGDRIEIGRYLLVAAAAAFRILPDTCVPDDVGRDAARVDGHGGDAGAA
jgi:hypothetical protein